MPHWDTAQQFAAIHHYKMQFRVGLVCAFNRIKGDRWGKKSVPVAVNSTGSGTIFGHGIQGEFWLQTSSALSSDCQAQSGTWDIQGPAQSQFTWGYWVLAGHSSIVQINLYLSWFLASPGRGVKHRLRKVPPSMVVSVIFSFLVFCQEKRVQVRPLLCPRKLLWTQWDLSCAHCFSRLALKRRICCFLNEIQKKLAFYHIAMNKGQSEHILQTWAHQLAWHFTHFGEFMTIRV